MKKPAVLWMTLFTAIMFTCIPLEAQAVRGPLAVSGNWPECTSLVTWIRDCLRLDGVENASETRQAISIYHWLRLFNRVSVGGMQHYWEGPAGEESYGLDAYKHLFVYGWGYCDTHSRIIEAAWREWTGDSTSVYRVCVMNERGGYHTMYRIRCGKSYGAFDARFGYYLIDRDSPDARVLDWEEVGDDRSFERNERFKNRCGPFFEYAVTEKKSALGMEPVFFTSEAAWKAAGMKPHQVFSDQKYVMGTAYHDMSWSLPRGTRIERFWNNQAKKFYSATKTTDRPTDKVLPSGRFFRVTAEMFDSNYAKHDPNYKRSAPYLVPVPRDEGYPEQMAGGKTIGQAWGTLEWAADFTESGYLDAVSSNTGMLRSPEPPYLRPLENGVPSEIVFDFYCPFVLVDGVFSGKLAGGTKDEVRLELRCLDPKPDSREEPDRWSGWREIASGHGPFEVAVGPESYAPGKVTVHGKYCFQLRVKTYAAPDSRGAGLEALKFKCYFENGIMSIPRLTPGKNTITFKVSDQGSVKAPITVTYKYETPGGEKTHRQTLNPRDFSGNRAAYIIDVPDLMRSNSLTIEY